MKVLKIMIVMLVLIMSVGAVCAADDISDEIISDDGQEDMYMVDEASFTDLTDEINNTGTTLDLTRDYAFNNETDNKIGISIIKDNFVLNGNGHIVDGKNMSRLFAIGGNNVTLSNLILINGNADNGGAVFTEGIVTLNNVTFINNYASTRGGAVGFFTDLLVNINNSKFIDNSGGSGQSIYVDGGNLNIYNTEFTSNLHSKDGQVILKNAIGYMDNVTFANIVSDYVPAIRLEKSKALTVLNSKFVNLTANITAGAFAIKSGGVIYIGNCEFTNTTSSKNAGAILADITGDNGLFPGNVTIVDTVFRDTSSGFGGAFIQFGGELLINNTEFINNHATYNGGSVYISYVDYAEVNDCNFTSNNVDIIENYPTYGGAMVIDMSVITINNSRFVNNTASEGNAIYAYDASYAIKNSLFENNSNAIYTFFDKESVLENNTFINDNISTNNTFYATIQVGEGMQLTLLNNTISVDTLPKRFDLRDWGWVSPIRNQGWMGACWTFGMTGTLESALLKATGIAADLSENNMQDSMLRYSRYGINSMLEGGGNLASVGYLLSWFGAFIQDADTYDELGKLSPQITTNQDIHVQDVMFTPNNEIPKGTQLKLAILKYGSIDVSYNGQSTYNEVTPYYNPETYAQYVNDSSIQPNHAVSIVGWDDNFPKEKFGITPPGDGAWIVKNSWGPDFGENGFLYVSYYDQTLLKSLNVISYATSIIIENTVPYNKNYQYDMFWGTDFVGNGTVRYMNVFEALGTDAIAAVGTYFNQSGINYTVEIYVNDVLKLTQDGVSPYYGFHTIKLDNYVPIKEGDVFKAVITSNSMPRVELKDARVHYTENISFISFDGETWEDAYNLGYIACLKVYTVALPIYTEDLVKIYKNDSKFEANIGVANETVTFEINGGSYNRTSDENGTARIAINLNPGNYTIKTTFNGTTVENSITVLPTLIADNLVKYFRNASQFYITLIDGQGNPVAGKNITMNINGVFYNRVTNENGTARLNINLNPGEYILTALDPLTGLQMSYNITVLSTLEAEDLEMKYKDGSTFNVTVLDGQGNPLAGVSVTFNINGVFYNRTTDSNGIARLNINLMAGEYIITSEYDDLRISNTIIIKD
ncbi:C1 family peptidase [Methanobrevibacter millerae]|uniref:Polymorphic outer membrane protein repeat-containing protein n=1 Tax=Methanobrevibacter millerae TaxID=230361 RepID=A0A1G5X249_9EURY|nr:C1 family peptidase [Methanobrevibacter millerae]SDA64451.1 polymorphic outer membrane protein repeat-containing protein [Methanobrevibacter millerae]